MTTDLTEIKNILSDLLKEQCPPLKVRTANEKVFEVAGTKPTMQGKQKVDGFYFASIMPKPRDVRFYFFPIYTHVGEYTLSDELKKSLKGKSCFHIKKLSDPMKVELGVMIRKGVELYQRDGHI